MAGSKRKKKLKGLFWEVSHIKQITGVYSTSVQLILNKLWTKFPDSLKITNGDFIDLNHYNILIDSFDRDSNSKEDSEKELAEQLSKDAMGNEMPIDYEKQLNESIVKILCSNGRGLNKKTTSNKQIGKRKQRLTSTYYLYSTFTKSQKKLTPKQEISTYLFTEQIKDYYLNKYTK